jgi:hypothetical protein
MTNPHEILSRRERDRDLGRNLYEQARREAINAFADWLDSMQGIFTLTFDVQRALRVLDQSFVMRGIVDAGLASKVPLVLESYIGYQMAADAYHRARNAVGQ